MRDDVFGSELEAAIAELKTVDGIVISSSRDEVSVTINESMP